ncbi:hypothetical protein NP233_g4 [Leucocoprinus birnbaumii]|uniref:F-box domain-containing protein n=1 Tax=Leucocoprinus birnbaumii TaxID=56174 RepID=A0AAD5Z0J9_9AGAR|nr:hypothetical protein NP233_g4 [Leucocoprinus birnbaumii]
MSCSPLPDSGTSRSLWDPIISPMKIVRDAANIYARLVGPTAELLDSGDHTHLLDIGAIWKLVRSGVWHPCEWENVEENTHAIDSVRDTMAFVVRRLDELEGKSATSTVDDVVLADFAGRRVQSHIRHCSVPELRCILAALQSLSSPWRKLPDELLIEVFSRCIPVNTVFSASEAPLLFTTICSRWHTLCINTPSLWTSVVLTENFLIHEEAHLRVATEFEKYWEGKAPNLGPKGPEFVSMILRRSRTLPLSLSSHSGILLHPDTRNLVYDNFFRLKDLAILIPEPDNWHDAPIPTSDRPLVAPHLENLHIYALRAPGPPLSHLETWASSYMDLIHSSAPTLRQLSLCVVSWPRVNFNHDWHNLTHITWRTSVPEGQLILLFHRAPNLVYASFPQILSGFYDATSSALVRNNHEVMAHLETLVVGVRSMEGVFNAITAPKLKHLVHTGPSSQDKLAMIAFFQRSACPLQTLYLYHAGYDSWIDLLDVLQSVESGVGASTADRKQATRRRGHLKALLVTDGHPDRGLISDLVMDGLTWKPDGGKRTVYPAESNRLAADQSELDAARSEEHNHSRSGDEVLFPGLEYLSFYDIGISCPGKLPELLRSRTAVESSASEPYNSHNEELAQKSASVAKLKVFETWHQDTGLNDVCNADWEAIETLRQEGLVLRTFRSEDNSRSCLSDEQKRLLEKYIREEGLIVRDFLHDTGQFAPIALDEEIQMTCVEP